MKRVITLILLLCMSLGICCHASAKTPDMSPQWTNILYLSNDIAFQGTNGSVVASAYGKSGTTAISGTLTVYKQMGSDWEYIDSESGVSTTATLFIDLDFIAESGCNYKAVFDVVVTRNGVDEPGNKTTEKRCP